MTSIELTTELQTGKTIADIAQEKDVSLDTIADAFLAPRTERMTLMVSNGIITQEQADTMLATIKANLIAQLSGEGMPGWGACSGVGDTDGDGICDNAGRGPRGSWGGGSMWR